MKWPFTAFAFIFAGLFLGLIAYVLNTSLWVMWELLPPQRSFAIALNQAFPQEKIVKMIPVSSQLIPPDVEPYMAYSTHIAWVQSDSGQVVVLAPSIWKIPFVSRQLQREGWNVEYIGGVIRASRGNHHTKSLTQAISAALQSIIKLKYALNPLFIAQSAPFSTLSEPLFAIGSVIGTSIEVDLLELNGKIPLTTISPLLSPVIKPEQLTLSTSGNVLKNVPVHIQNIMSEKLSHIFGFVKKQPDFIKELSESKQILLYIDTDTVVIGAFDSLGFADIAHKWLQEEERRYRLERRPFLLPDKTGGFEYVPGAAQPLLQADATYPGCLKTTTGAIQAFVCTHGHYTLFTNNPAVVPTLPLPEPTETYLIAGSNELQQLGLGILEEAILRTHLPWTHLHLKLSQQ